MKRIDLLIAVATELQQLCEFDPPIKTKGKSEKELELAIKEAATQLTPDDKLSDQAVSVLAELGVKGYKVKEKEEEPAEEPAKEAAAPKRAEKAPAVQKEKAEKPVKEKDPNQVRLSTEEKIAFFKPLIESGKYTMVELVKKATEKYAGLSESSIRTFLTDSKNEKYNKFDKLVVAGEDGKVSFKK